MNKINKSIFLRLMSDLPKKNLLFIGIVLILTLSFTHIGESFFIQIILDAAVDKDKKLFFLSVYLIIGLALIDVIFTFLQTKIIGIYAESGVKNIREKLAHKYNHLKIETMSNHHSGDFVSRATNDVSKIKNYISNTMPQLISTSLLAILALTYLLILNWKLTLISLVLTPLLILGVNFLSRPLGKISKHLQEKLSHVNTIVQDFIKGVEVSKAYNLERTLENTYQVAVNESMKSGKELAKKRAIISGFSEFLSIIPFFITFFLGGYAVIQGEMSLGGLIAFINLLNFVTNPMTSLPRLFSSAKIDLGAGSRIYEILDEVEERTDGTHHEMSGEENIIEFDHINFSYPGTLDSVLNDFKLNIKKGESVALVGPSGGGKSTVMRLLQGYYDNYEGQINICGHELKNWNLHSLREKMALVSQDVFLFPDSILENISYGKIGSSKDEIVSVSHLAYADSFIENLPNQYETEIGELGNKLSGGQKQRISIARAFLKNTEILLLDEATSALDNESEAIVQRAIEELMKNKTSVIIAHRLSTIRNVDRIIVISDGKVVEEGTHNDLIEKAGIYKDLYSKQMKLDQNKEVA